MSATILPFVPRTIPAKAQNVMHTRRYGDIIGEMAKQIIAEYEDVHTHNKSMNIDNCHMREVLIDKLATKYSSTRDHILQDIQDYIVINYDELHNPPKPEVTLSLVVTSL